MSIVSRRHEFVFLFDVSHGNPNGDPDAGNAPRTDPETGQGLVTDVSIKRKIRDFVALTQEARIADGFDIFVQHQGILAHRQRDAHVAVGAVPGRAANADARAWMCRRFYDVRAFGAVMTTGKAEA
jgi:CRISPR-associated protein Csd2